MKNSIMLFGLSLTMVCVLSISCRSTEGAGTSDLSVTDSTYFSTRGLDVLVFNNSYDAAFDDSKVAGVELIHHGVRSATNGDVRLNPTPGQWGAHPSKLIERTVDIAGKTIRTTLAYEGLDFIYQIQVRAADGGVYYSVSTDKPIPDALVGIAGLNLEFTPAAYWGKSYIMDHTVGQFQHYPADAMTTINGLDEPKPIVSGHTFNMAPECAERHILISSPDSELMLFDGRNLAQNGWFVVRSLLPAGKTGKLAEWFIQAETIPNWTRKPNIAHSQVGYSPMQPKTAVVELDKNDTKRPEMRLLKIGTDGQKTVVKTGKPTTWGNYLRYNYLTFDFSDITEPGVYQLQYDNELTNAFLISNEAFQHTWQQTLDVFIPVQMDHMFVREGYRVWHGAPHLDDALQAPTNYSHWDGWAQGATTGSKYKPFEHIPGLNVGGWFDAGDFDIQTPSQQAVVTSLVSAYEDFNIQHDETLIDQQKRYVEIHLPDGTPDVVQQIEHGALQLVAQIKAIGYTMQGINESHLWQYRHLGDAVNKTNNKVYTGKPERDMYHPLIKEQPFNDNSEDFDDRFAFTTRSGRLDYGSVTALAGAARVLKGYNDQLAADCIAAAKKLFNDQQTMPQPPASSFPQGIAVFGGPGQAIRPAFELWRTTGEKQYLDKFNELLPEALERFNFNVSMLAEFAPYLGDDFKQKLMPKVKEYVAMMEKNARSTPFGVMISRGGWAGNSGIIGQSVTAYHLWKLFPELIDPKYIFAGLDYIYGTHPDTNLSFVTGIGADTKKIAYGNTRANFTYIPGGIVPGVRILNPNYPENRNDYPFIWSENEYVIGIAPQYIYYVHAVNDYIKNKL